jgi:small subunit ribosomal protein S6
VNSLAFAKNRCIFPHLNPPSGTVSVRLKAFVSNGLKRRPQPKGKKEMPLYETVFIARQDISAKQAEDLLKNFEKIVNDNGGKVKKTESWGLRTLAYKIKKNKKGHYALLHSDAPPKAIAEMERNIRLNEDVLRYMTVAIDKLPEGPSPVLKSPEEDGRGERGEFSRDREFSKSDRDFGKDREFKEGGDRGF